MTILINAISARQGGGQTYLNNLLSRIPEHFNRKIYLLDNQLLTENFRHPMIEAIKVPERIVRNPFMRAFWERFWLPIVISRLNVKTYFTPGGLISIMPNASCRTVTMCRNMLPFDLKQRKKYELGYMRFRNWLLSKQLQKSFEKADHVIFISNFAQKHLTKDLGFNIKDFSIIPHGVDPIFYKRQTNSFNFCGLKANQYFLYVSTIDVYKAQIEVVVAFDQFRKATGSSRKLVLVGSTYGPYLKLLLEKIQLLDLTGEVVLLGKVPHERLPELYQNAKANIFASECENCPNILLEALSSGRPVICSNREPMPEFAGKSAIYFDPSRPEELAKVLTLLEQNQLPPQENISVAELYSWDRTSAKTWALLESL